jgi:hypothetical protein
MWNCEVVGHWFDVKDGRFCKVSNYTLAKMWNLDWFNLLAKPTYSWALWDWSHMEKCDTCQRNYVSDITFGSKFHPIPPISISNFGICQIIQ